MALGLALSGGSHLALTSTPAARYIAADGAPTLRTDAQMALGFAASGGLDLALTTAILPEKFRLLMPFLQF